MRAWGAALLVELAKEAGRALVDWARSKRDRREDDLRVWEDIQRRHVERRRDAR